MHTIRFITFAIIIVGVLCMIYLSNIFNIQTPPIYGCYWSRNNTQESNTNKPELQSVTKITAKGKILTFFSLKTTRIYPPPPYNINVGWWKLRVIQRWYWRWGEGPHLAILPIIFVTNCRSIWCLPTGAPCVW